TPDRHTDLGAATAGSAAAPAAPGGTPASSTAIQPIHLLPARPGFTAPVRTPVAGLSPVRLASGTGSPG
ncbi:MAG: hypothetical protein AAGC46_20980, partial [Solirubrobacteraceae bacterium]